MRWWLLLLLCLTIWFALICKPNITAKNECLSRDSVRWTNYWGALVECWQWWIETKQKQLSALFIQFFIRSFYIVSPCCNAIAIHQHKLKLTVYATGIGALFLLFQRHNCWSDKSFQIVIVLCTRCAGWNKKKH